MSKYKVCVYAICKNEEQFVDRWMDAVSEADLVVVTDTGSTDNTVEKLRVRGALVYEESINPWRFDVARNIALDHVPKDVDICVSNDIDEIFENGWREKLENVWTSTHTRARYLFTWSYNNDGTPKKQFQMEKIHSRYGFKWIHPVHEILEYNGVLQDNVIFVPGLILNHYPDPSKSRTQYLSLLELSAKENPSDDRTIFWLGREYMYYKMYDECIKTLKQHLKLPKSSWNEERCASMRFIAHSYQEKGNLNEARRWFYRAIAECPTVREPYLDAAQFGYNQSDWALVYLMVKKALSIVIPSGSYLLESEAWGYKFYDLGAISCYHLEMYEKARDFCLKAITIEKDNERLKSNLKLIENKLRRF